MIAAVAAVCLEVGDRNCIKPSQIGSEVDSDATAAPCPELTDTFDVEFVSAFSEIFNNIVLHSYAGGSDDEIVIEMQATANQLVVRITDHGAPFDPKDTTEPDLDLLPEGGMGIFIARAFLDAARYEPGPPNHWILEKCYDSRDAASKTSDTGSASGGVDS